MNKQGIGRQKATIQGVNVQRPKSSNKVSSIKPQKSVCSRNNCGIRQVNVDEQNQNSKDHSMYHSKSQTRISSKPRCTSQMNLRTSHD